MGMTDPISDMLTRIRNAQAVRKRNVDVPHSKMKERVGRILVEEGYLKDLEVVQPEEGWPVIRMGLKYFENKPVIEVIQRASKPGRRLYCGKDDIPRVRQGLGVSILSTSRGVISSREARKLGVGGELICTVF